MPNILAADADWLVRALLPNNPCITHARLSTICSTFAAESFLVARRFRFLHLSHESGNSNFLILVGFPIQLLSVNLNVSYRVLARDRIINCVKPEATIHMTFYCLHRLGGPSCDDTQLVCTC